MAVSSTPLIVDSRLRASMRATPRWAARTDNNYNKAFQLPLARARPTSMRLRKHPLVVAAVMTAVLACAGVLLALRVADRIGEGTLVVSLLALLALAGVAAVILALAATRSFSAVLRRADDALGEQRSIARHLDEIFSAVGDGILVTSPDGRIERANRAAHAMLGMRQGELIDRPIDDGLDAASALEPTAPGGPREVVLRKANGGELTASCTVARIPAKRGEPEHVVLGLQDIEERKRVEQRIRNLARIDPLTKL